MMNRKNATIHELQALFHQNARAYLSTPEWRGVRHAEELAQKCLLAGGPADDDAAARHALGIAVTLSELKVDRPCLEAGLLLTVVEKGCLQAPDLEKDSALSSRTPALVDGAVRISQLSFTRGRITRAESFRKLILTMARDIRVILIKLADRAVLMNNLSRLPAPDQQPVARETMDIYAPLANRLGIHRLKSELEDLAFRYLNPDDYMRIKSRVAVKRSQREYYIHMVQESLAKLLGSEQLQGSISGRSKHFWSIQKKLQQRGLDFDDLYDITAFRIIVDTIPQCYQVLGAVHNRWRPIPDTFDDYIAVPKPNGYQSLHTAVIGPQGERIEIQIRTKQMHEIAENGVAAHWRYKESDKGAFSESSIRQFGWLHEMLKSDRQQFDEKVLDTLRTDLFEDEVFVFTPTGDVRELQQGATPLDFAYAIHTQVGHTCVGAKVNGRIVPLQTTLHNGDIVEIITHPRGKPSTDWLDIVVSSRARQKIRYFLGEEERKRARQAGRDILEKMLKIKGWSLPKILKDETRIQRTLDKLKCRTVDELFLALGRHTADTDEALSALVPESMAPAPTVPDLFESTIAKPLLTSAGKKGGSGILVAGIEGMEVRYARCCNPVVGDDILGYITRGRGVTVHRRQCNRLPAAEEARLVDVQWAMSGHETMPVRIRVVTEDKPGILAQVSEIFKKFDMNVSSLNMRTRDDQGILMFIIHVHSVDELRQVTAAISATRGVYEVVRVADAYSR
ncbi:MAG: bifunctional (p)ppGpp synthetase/guanosine-3',5'-bis(diphosphate) 3'-pyrophosphohydrolase [Acidobacteria bacterium]|nr:bifunctional (p)ppGpp synthetase/guanosine-3',5'-bis(diphosphate) 3'-pyrophosphohydrolase [Acidobacteriota bacterium]